MLRTLRSALCLAVCLSAPLAAQSAATVRGRVTDTGGQPVSYATVSIVELGRSATTASDGAFSLGSVPAGHYTIAARRLGLGGAAKAIVVAGTTVDVALTLPPALSALEPVNVTASRLPTSDRATSLSTSVLTGDEIHAQGGVSLGHAIERLAGVRNVSTGQQTGKPMIRGLYGARTLTLAGGSRIEDYSWSDEDAPSIDPRMAQRIEVIRGPASVLYGSDALSGVINVIPADVPFSADGARTRSTALEAYGASSNIEAGGALMAQGTRSRYGWSLFGVGRFGQNYHTPDGHVQNSGFGAFNADAAFGIRDAAGGTIIRGAHYGGEFKLLEASGPEVDDPEGGPVRRLIDDRIQVANSHLVHGMRLETKAQWQRHDLAEVSDDCQPAPGETTCAKVKDEKAFGLVLNTGTVDVLGHHTIGAHVTGTVGVSGMYQRSTSTGPIFLVPSATTASGAVFAFEQLTLGRVDIAAGARVDRRSLSSDQQLEITRPADERDWRAGAGDAGVVVHVTDALSLTGNLGAGWRAPTLFDLFASGPNLADARYEIGDPALAVERGRNSEGGARWSRGRLRAEVAVFRNLVDDFIYTTPTSEMYNGLAVFRHVQGDATLSGAEGSAEVRLTTTLSAHVSHDFVRGTDRTADTPLPLMPPARTIVGTDWRAGDYAGFHHVTVGIDLDMHAEQTRLNANDFATDGYSLFNVAVSADRSVSGRNVRFDIVGKNVTNSSYRDFLSRYKQFALAPGMNVILKAAVGAW